MKKLLLILCLPIFTFAQQTYVPDDIFEQHLINLGYDNALDDYVLTANINVIDTLDLSYLGISDLTGIEDFTSLVGIDCKNNNLTSLDLSNNTNLTYVYCSYNNLTSLDISSSPNLGYLYCSDNQLTSLNLTNNSSIFQFRCENNNLSSLDLSTVSVTFDLDCSFNQLTSLDLSGCYNLFTLNCSNNLLDSLDVSMLTSLFGLFCSENNIKELDVSNNIFLNGLYCDKNQLHTLDISHGNLDNLAHDGWSYMFDVRTNPLNCIKVATSDLNWANSNLDYPTYINNTMHFSDSCIPPPVNITEVVSTKKIMKIIDVLGRKTRELNNIPLFYIYDDNSVEKKIIFE